MVKVRQSPTAPRDVAFAKTRGRGLLECIPLNELFQRAPANHWKNPEILQFHLWVLFSAGACRHLVDFESLRCRAHTLLHVRPGQVHRWDRHPGLDGYALLVGLNALSPHSSARTSLRFDPREWPQCMALSPDVAARVSDHLARMVAVGRDPTPSVEPLLYHLAIAALLEARLDAHAWRPQHESAARDDSTMSRFHTLLEKSYADTRSVREYARVMRCSTRTLDRCTQAAVQKSAKSVIDARVVLEAKRRLVHSDATLDTLALALGFSDATNFAKYFKHHTGLTPGSFRAQYDSARVG